MIFTSDQKTPAEQASAINVIWIGFKEPVLDLLHAVTDLLEAAG